MSISQNIYPKEIVLNGDSLIAITYNQQRVINADLEELKGCRVVLDSTETLVLRYDTLMKDGTLLVQNLNKQIELKDDQLVWKDETINLYNKEYKKMFAANKGLKIGLGIGLTIAFGAGLFGLIYGVTQ